MARDNMKSVKAYLGLAGGCGFWASLRLLNGR